MHPSRPHLKQRALKWLAQREHSRMELRGRLLQLCEQADRRASQGEALTVETDPHSDVPCADEVEPLLDWLESKGYLSDKRFIDSRVRSRQERYGNRRIEHELSQHHLQLDPQARDALAASELTRAMSIWTRRFGAMPQTAAERARQMRFLLGRGFSAATVSRLWREVSAAQRDACGADSIDDFELPDSDVE